MGKYAMSCSCLSDAGTHHAASHLLGLLWKLISHVIPLSKLSTALSPSEYVTLPASIESLPLALMSLLYVLIDGVPADNQARSVQLQR